MIPNTPAKNPFSRSNRVGSSNQQGLFVSPSRTNRVCSLIQQGWIVATLLFISFLNAQDAPVRGSIVEDRAAKKLLEAGDARIEAEETEKALEIWRSVIERYPRSKFRFDAHLRLGSFLLEKRRAFDEARGHFEAVDVEANTDDAQRAAAALQTGVCFYEGRLYGQCFKVLRRVIEDYPSSEQVNSAYYFIGLGHFKQGHYSRAIEALEKVGTALSEEDAQIDKVEAGKRLFVKVADQDLAVLEPGETVTLRCKAKSGDEEDVICHPIGRQVRVILGSIPTALGAPAHGNGRLEVQGGDTIEVTYIDAQTADRKFDEQRLYTVNVVGTAIAQIMDGSFGDTLAGVVIGKQANLEILDADFDTGDGADKLTATAEIWREKSTAELDEEIAAAAAKQDPLAETNEDGKVDLKVERFKKIDETKVTLTEASIVREVFNEVETADETPGDDAAPAPESAPITETEAAPPTVHSGIFRGQVVIADEATPKAGDPILQAQPGDLLRLRYRDEKNLTRASIDLTAQARCIEGNLGNVRVTKTDISNAELKIKTQLGSADALTNIGNHYREFGLQKKADLKYEEALSVANEVLAEARKLGGSILENAYVQLWRTYFAMENYNLAVAMSQQLMKEFPESTFVDQAMLQQADAFRAQGKLPDAIRLYGSILRLNDSPLKGEAQFGIAETYEKMAADAAIAQSDALYERAFVEYHKVYESFPDSGRVGDAVAKMANFYYKKQDYSRAIDVFENVLSEYPDANFLDVILFNYGRCLFRLDRKAEARRMFDQLINEFPESSVAGEAKRISDALVKAGI